MIIAISNHKGGTGKTTTTINIGCALQAMGKKILLVDADPQGNLSYSLELSGSKYTLVDLLLSPHSLDPIQKKSDTLHVITADKRLYDSADIINSEKNCSTLLLQALKHIKHRYDFILIDCAPTFSTYTVNALNAADGVIIPLVFEILSIQGLDQILSEIKRIKKISNPHLEVIGVLGVIVNENRKLTNEVLEYVRDNYQVNIFNNYIRSNVKTAEAPSFGKSVLEYAPRSSSAIDYMNVAKELLAILSPQNLIIQ